MAALRDRAPPRTSTCCNALNDVTEFKGTTDIVASRMDTMQAALGRCARHRGADAQYRAHIARTPVSRRYLREGSVDGPRSHQFVPLNAQVAGRNLFSGIQTDTAPMQAQTGVNAATGLSPQQAVSQAIANVGPITDAASALAVANGPDGVRLDLQRHQQQPNLELLRRSITARAPVQ